MAATDEAAGGATDRLATNAVVTLIANGACLARRGEHERISLGYPELRILQDLAAGHAPDLPALAEALGRPVTELTAFVDALAARGLLRAGSPPPAPATEPPGGSGEAVDPAVPLLLATPISFRVTARGFEHTGHDGDLLVVLDAAELDVATRFSRPTAPVEVQREHTAATGPHALGDAAFEGVLGRLLASGVASVHDPSRPGHAVGQDRTKLIMRALLQQESRVRTTTAEDLARHAQEAAAIDARVGHPRVPITPIHQNPMVPPLGLAMVMAYAKAVDDGRLQDHYDFLPDWLAHERSIEDLTARPGVFLVSNYIWSHRDNLALAARIKAASPHSVMIHGGPDTPKYKGDVIEYFRINPHVDVAVHVEGEVTTAELLTALQGWDGQGPADLSPLRDVPGLSFRDGDRVVQTSERERLEDLDVIPSPYLTGLFDNYGNAPTTSITIETNRGCPYGCTFCDWGSATMSRIRKFDLDRVFAELEWAAQRGIQGIGFADANFGILERDVAIAEKVASLKEQYGFPVSCGTNYAKNTVKHLNKIVSMWVDAGIVTQGMLSLQTMDTETLTTIRRSNIRTEKYDALAEEFRRAELPLFVDLMMGLPGQTVTSFRHDLQDTLEREVVAKIHPTTLLMNSPMNDPEYKKLHRIEVANSTNLGLGNRIDQTVVSTSSFSREDYEEMKRLRRNFLMLENFGVLRHVARFVRQETGLLEEELYETVARLARSQPERWPAIEFTVESGSNVMAPPVSWRQFVDEVHDLLVTELGVPDDAALATVLTVQHGLLPAPDRSFPAKYHLAHDYAAWHQAMLDAKAEVGPEWTTHVPRLATFGPAEFTVDDSHHVCTQGMGYEIEQGWLDTWDLESPVARPTLVREMAG